MSPTDFHSEKYACSEQKTPNLAHSSQSRNNSSLSELVYESKKEGVKLHVSLDRLKPAERYFRMIDIVVPRPIAWVSTCDREGRHNLAPFSYFTAVSSDPACIMFSISSKRGGVPKDTLNNIKQTQQFVVNTVPKHLDQAMVNTSREFDAGVSEFTECRVESSRSNWIEPPRVTGCCSALECRLFDLLPIKNEKANVSHDGGWSGNRSLL